MQLYHRMKSNMLHNTANTFCKEQIICSQMYHLHRQETIRWHFGEPHAQQGLPNKTNQFPKFSMRDILPSMRGIDGPQISTSSKPT